MYEVTYLSESGMDYLTMEIEADSKEAAREIFLAKTGKNNWEIYCILEMED
jgi:hypothetical protein